MDLRLVFSATCAALGAAMFVRAQSAPDAPTPVASASQNCAAETKAFDDALTAKYAAIKVGNTTTDAEAAKLAKMLVDAYFAKQKCEAGTKISLTGPR